jgi:hypothetical protein
MDADPSGDGRNHPVTPMAIDPFHPVLRPVTILTGLTDPILTHTGDIFVINHDSVVANPTLDNPVADDDGQTIWIINGNVKKNIVNLTGSLGGDGSSNKITFSGIPSANVVLQAYNSNWYIIGGFNFAA